jgi:hypothetical protein
VGILAPVPTLKPRRQHHVQRPDALDDLARVVPLRLGWAAICFAATSAQAARWWPGAFGPGLRWIRRGKADSSFGMDLLVGTVAGIALALVDRAYLVVPAVFGWPPPSPLTALAYLNPQPQVLGGPAAALGYLLYQAARLGWLISVNLWWFCLLKLMCGTRPSRRRERSPSTLT